MSMESFPIPHHQPKKEHGPKPGVMSKPENMTSEQEKDLKSTISKLKGKLPAGGMDLLAEYNVYILEVVDADGEVNKQEAETILRKIQGGKFSQEQFDKSWDAMEKYLENLVTKQAA